jgi:hypothetical protein
MARLTIGDTSEYTTEWNAGYAYLRVARASGGTTIIADKLFVYLSNTGSPNYACAIKAAVYDFSTYPTTLKAKSGSNVAIAAGQALGWVECPLAVPVPLGSQSYWGIGVWLSSGCNGVRLRSSSSVSRIYNRAWASSEPPDPWGGGSADWESLKASLYIEGEEWTPAPLMNHSVFIARGIGIG